MLEQELMLNLYSSLGDKKSKVSIFKLHNEELTNKLKDVQDNLLAARETNIKLRTTADQAFQLLSSYHIKAVLSKETRRRKADMIEHLRQIAKEDYVPQQKKSYHEAQLLTKGFLKESSSAPWIPEKKQMLNELSDDINELENIREDLQAFNRKIEELKATTELHGKYPFQTFCVDIITYRRKAAALKKLLIRELRMNEEMKTKLIEKCGSIEESQELSQSQLQSQPIRLHTQSPQRRDDLEKSVLENNERETTLIDDTGDNETPKTAVEALTNAAQNLDLSYLNKDPEESTFFAVDSFVVDDDLSATPVKNVIIDDHSSVDENEFDKSVPEQGNEDNIMEAEQADPILTSTPAVNNPTIAALETKASASPIFVMPTKPPSAPTPILAPDARFSFELSNSKSDGKELFFSMDVFGKEDESKTKNSLIIGDHSMNDENEFEKSAAGDFMSMLNMVNESQNASVGGSAFFGLFGTDGDKKRSGNDSQESVGELFNFNFGNSSLDDGQGDGAVNSKKSFFDF